VAEVGQANNAYKGYTYTREGSPLKLLLPLEAGDYEVRYILSQDRTVAARRPLRVDPITASLAADAQTPAGGTLVVTWEGPGYQADFIAISEPDQLEGAYKTYTYTRDGSPLKVQVPAEPGSYEVRYVASTVGRKMIAKTELEVTPVDATIDVEATAAPGGVLEVNWTGPGYPQDYVTISKAGDNGYVSYVYTREGSPILLKVPEISGDYEVRYVMGQGRTVLTASPVKVE
jgi:Ca-activated chloride channel family protein